MIGARAGLLVSNLAQRSHHVVRHKVAVVEIEEAKRFKRLRCRMSIFVSIDPPHGIDCSSAVSAQRPARMSWPRKESQMDRLS
jgi:hypothetical protein